MKTLNAFCILELNPLGIVIFDGNNDTDCHAVSILGEAAMSRVPLRSIENNENS